MVNIQTNLANVVNTTSTEIKNLIGNTTDDASKETIFGKLFAINNKVETINTTTTDTKTLVNDLSLTIGTVSDVPGSSTLFGKIGNLSGMVHNTYTKLNAVEGKIDTIDGIVDIINSNTDLNKFTDSNIAALVAAYENYYTTVNPGASTEAKMGFVIDYLRTNGYLK